MRRMSSMLGLGTTFILAVGLAKAPAEDLNDYPTSHGPTMFSAA